MSTISRCAALTCLCLLMANCADNSFATRADVVKEIVAGTLVPGRSGEVILPPKYSSTSVDGKVYVTTDSDGNQFVIFPDWVGKGSNFSGVLYMKNVIAPQPKTLDLFGPDIPGLPATVTLKKVSINIGKRLRDHWYEASFDLD